VQLNCDAPCMMATAGDSLIASYGRHVMMCDNLPEPHRALVCQQCSYEIVLVTRQQERTVLGQWLCVHSLFQQG